MHKESAVSTKFFGRGLYLLLIFLVLQWFCRDKEGFPNSNQESSKKSIGTDAYISENGGASIEGKEKKILEGHAENALLVFCGL